MANFQFTDADGKAAILGTVDDEIRADLGLQPNPDRTCQWYQTLIELGFAVLMNSGGFFVTKKDLDAHLAKSKERFPEYEIPEDHYNMMVKYLAGGKYTFHGWR